MTVFKFRIYLEQDDTIFRDVEIKPTQTFEDFHKTILQAFSFDGKHEASFYKSNDNWNLLSEISLNKKENAQLMSKIALGLFIDDPHEKLVYVYDYDAEWTFLLELLAVEQEQKKTIYPRITRTEGVAPKQYGAQPIVGGDIEGFETEEIYDEHEAGEMGEEGEDDEVKTDETEEEESEFGAAEFGSEEL